MILGQGDNDGGLRLQSPLVSRILSPHVCQKHGKGGLGQDMGPFFPVSGRPGKDQAHGIVPDMRAGVLVQHQGDALLLFLPGNLLHGILDGNLLTKERFPTISRHVEVWILGVSGFPSGEADVLATMLSMSISTNLDTLPQVALHLLVQGRSQDFHLGKVVSREEKCVLLPIISLSKEFQVRLAAVVVGNKVHPHLEGQVKHLNTLVRSHFSCRSFS